MGQQQKGVEICINRILIWRSLLGSQWKWIWCPPPCLAKIAVEQLCKVKHVLSDSQHIFICPALMTGYWRKKLGKLVDTMFSLKAGCFAWPSDMYESLTIAFVKPFLPSPPWKVRHLPEMDKWERSVSALQWTGSVDFRRHMRKFWSWKTSWVSLFGNVAC